MDANVEQPLPSPEVVAFRRYYNDLLRFVDRPVDLARLLISEGVISEEVTRRLTWESVREQGRVILDAFEQSLLQSSEPRATLRCLARAFEQAGSYSRHILRMKSFADCECTISLIHARKRNSDKESCACVPGLSKCIITGC